MVCFIVPGILIGGLVKLSLGMSSVDSIWQVLLYPTGIPFVFRYLDVAGSLRHILDRRI